MSYSLRYHKKLYKFLEKCEKYVAQSFSDSVKILSKNPYNNILDIKPLKWEEKLSFRLRIGKYRFKYKIIDMEIVIYFYEADSRWDIYK